MFDIKDIASGQQATLKPQQTQTHRAERRQTTKNIQMDGCQKYYFELRWQSGTKTL